MRITGLDIHEVAVDGRQSWVFVQVHAGDGISGLGEMNPSAPRRACLDAVREIGDALQGRDPRRIAEIAAGLEPEKLDRAGVHAFSAVEQALWDILAKSLGKPVHALFGERIHREIPVYANITRGTRELTPRAFARSAAGAAADGYTAMKLAPFGGELMKRDRAAAVANGIECARAAREAIGPEADLMLDCYGIFSAGEASGDRPRRRRPRPLLARGAGGRGRRRGVPPGKGGDRPASRRGGALHVPPGVPPGPGGGAVRRGDAGRDHRRRRRRAVGGCRHGRGPGDRHRAARTVRPGADRGAGPGDGGAAVVPGPRARLGAGALAGRPGAAARNRAGRPAAAARWAPVTASS